MRVKMADLQNAVDRARGLGPGVVADWKRSRDELLARLQDDPDMFAALAERLRQDFAETLTQSHDFLQLVKLVRGYSESLLLEKHPGISPEDAAERSPAEGAIFFATELMLVKMDALIFLNEVNRAFGSESRVRIHPYLLKYLRIYAWQADQKNLTIQLVGECFASAWYNANAIGAVFQGLLDNLVKYAPAGSKAVVRFEDYEDEVVLRFVSLGPKIERSEVEKIFLPGFRAVAARATASDGLGVGLATSKSISDALGLGLRVEQDDAPDEKYAARYETTFSVRLRKLDAPS
ncbi:sensor histidine kinase [Phycicoccus flavus]|uniref:Sensor-like histidine kinase SenX3 n=1 Tax=Phycicoccus flavus TaxID=2502783 RepID=A0A8T6RAR1_9MICO|nr:sensor histidine kinase [Phycicoccus flavus]NHA69915.1 sensor histidine kinase [Phycicoccus flavus]